MTQTRGYKMDAQKELSELEIEMMTDLYNR